MTSNKEKRKRTSDDGMLDFLPLSKRINNLHIDNKNLSVSHVANYCIAGSDGSSIIQENNNTSDLNHNDITLGVNNCDRINDPRSVNISNNSQKTSVELMGMAEYNPDLSQIENPYYYIKNKLLYDLYVERMRRCAYSNFGT